MRHIERTRVLVHLIDMVPLDGGTPAQAYQTIRAELAAYSPKLANKPEILVANKMDLTGAPEQLAELRLALPGHTILAISAATGTGLRPLLESIWQLVQSVPPAEPFAAAMDAAANLALEAPDDDSQLAMEIAAIKADDQRKGRYYKKSLE